MKVIDEIILLFEQRGDSLYGGELITQRDHALQAATLAENENVSPELIAAALLHDIGHLVHDLPHDSTQCGVDDQHETLGETYLESAFGANVAIPVRLHVPAKRYLCAVEEDYMGRLSQASQVSLRLQGGPFAANEMEEFKNSPHWQNAVRLRRWDDLAKVQGMLTPTLEHFKGYMIEVLKTEQSHEQK